MAISRRHPWRSAGLRAAPSSRATGLGRVASFGLVALLIALPGFAFWGALSNYRAGEATRHAVLLSNALQEARYQTGAEESLERKYRIQPGPEIEASHHAAAQAMQAALGTARTLAAPAEAARIDHMLALHQRYLTVAARMFAAVDAGNLALYEQLDRSEGDPAFAAIEDRVLALAALHHGQALKHLQGLAALQMRVLITTPLVFALGLVLVTFFSGVLRSFQAEARAAVAREALSLVQSERRLKSLIQNATDLVLICRADGAVSYQSPAAEAAWGYAQEELLGRLLIALIHAEDQPAAGDLWEQVLAAPGETRTTELRLCDRAGDWRYVELILTNLLREPALQGVVATVHDINERKLFEQELTRQAFYDGLTGLPNRALFHDRLGQALMRSGRRERSVGLLFLDLDNFKLVNDSLGHQTGDRLLVEAAQRLSACVRPGDTVARLGGDEFVVLLEYLSSEADALPVVEMIARRFARPFALDGRELVVTASIGVALAEPGQEEGETLLRNADVAMYRAKSGGKGRHVVFDPSMHRDALARFELESELRHALERGELRVFYQPIVAMETGRIIEVEALVRWQHPAKGLIGSSFIGIAEETGLIVGLGAWVLREACGQVAAWNGRHASRPPLVVGVNLSPREFQQPDLTQEVTRTLAETGLPASCLKLEVTETTIMQDVEATITTLGDLKALGLQVAIDDFGTGYSSLSYLKRLPLDVLKVDGSFVRGIGEQQEDTAIVRAILSLAKSLGLTVTAEGIETAEQAALLRAWGCDRGQGYYFGRALDPAGLAEMLDDPELGAPHSRAA